MFSMHTDYVRDYEEREARQLDRDEQRERVARFAPQFRPVATPVAGDMIKCPKCGTWHYRNDPCAD